MSSSALSILTGIGAAAAGLAGEKVSKSGEIPGLDISLILPALLGKSEGTGSLIGGIASAVAKSGILKNVNLAELAGSLLSLDKGSETGAAGKIKAGTVAELALKIIGSSGKGADLGAIASLASGLAKNAKDKKGLTSIATELGKSLSDSGVNFSAGGAAVKALDKVLEKDVKADLFKAVLKGLV